MVNLVEFNKNHVERAAQLYSEAMPDDFISQFGTELLKLINLQICNTTYSFGLSFVENGTLGGYIVCSLEADKLFSSVIKNHFFSLLWIGIKKSITKPLTLLEFFKARSVIKKVGKYGTEVELVTAALDPSFRGRGIGKALYIRACETCFNMGAEKIRATIHDEDPVINSLYAKLGFKKVGNYIFRNTTRNIMILDKNDPESYEIFTSELIKLNQYSQ